MFIQKNTVVTIFGDSIPKGVISENGNLKKIEQNTPYILSQHFGFELNNLSLYGQTISHLEEKELVAKFLETTDNQKNNVVVFSLGGNDSDFDWKDVARSPEQNHTPKTPLDKFEKLLTKYVKLMQKNDIEVYLTTITPVDSKKYFDNVICKIADGKNILKYFDEDISIIQRHQECYNNAIIGIAQRCNAKLIDIRTPLLLDKNFLSKMCDDGVHPNQSGHKFMAQEIIKQIESV